MEEEAFSDWMNKLYYRFLMIAGIFAFIMSIYKPNNSPTYTNAEIKTMLKEGFITEAVTHHFRTETVIKRRSWWYSACFVDYTYFVDGQEFTITKYELGKVSGNFQRFKKPQLCRLVYAMKNPIIHDIDLAYYPDTITNFDLKRYVNRHYNTRRINGVDSIGVTPQ